MATANCHRADHSTYCFLLEDEIARFIALARELDPSTRVPTCPDWTAADLVQHLGQVHRWCANQVRVVTPKRIPSSTMDMEEPGAFAGRPAWLETGAVFVLDALRSGDPDAPMWAWGDDQHVRFWARRMLHESTVHRADAEFTLGREPAIDAGISVDGIDEFLDNLPRAANFAPRVTELMGSGERVGLRCTDAGTAWTIRLGPTGFTWDHNDDAADATIEGAAADLYLLAWGRRRTDDAGRFTVSGERALIDFWRERTSL